MKSIFRGGFFLTALTVLLLGTAVWYVCTSDDTTTGTQQPFRAPRLAKKEAKKTEKELTQGIKRKKIRKVRSVSQDKVEKPDLSLAADDDAQLSETMRQIYQELQLALDNEDKKQVFALVHKLQSMDEWPDGIPMSVKMKALESLAWFGGAGMAEAVGFLADSDPEVVNATVEKFEEMLGDFDLGDKGLSEILSQIVKVVHDTDALDSFYMEMNNMRDTVKAQTALNIYDCKNKDAISVLENNLDFIFGDADYEVKTRADVEKFLKDAEQVYVDDPEKAAEDELFYGPPQE